MAVRPEAAWEALSHVRHWPRWGPTVQAVDAAEDRVREGLEGRVRTSLGFWVPFRITEVEGWSWAWAISGIPATGHAVEARPGGCEVFLSAPVWAWPYVVVLKLGLRGIERCASQISRSSGDRDPSRGPGGA
jgi:hypothetical protein